MTVITKYDLIGRDSNDVGPKWKVLAIIGLSAAVVASVGCSFSFYSLNHGFDPRDDRCIIGASPKLKTIQQNTTNITTIDFPNSAWGLHKDCDFAIYAPLFQGITATIWISLFIVCGNGGVNKSTDSSLVPKPYLVVMPAFIYFFAMIILAAVEATFINDGISLFCRQLQNVTERNSSSCRQLFNDYSSHYEDSNEKTYSILSPEWNYLLTLIFCWGTLATFCLCLVIMIMRCIFVADFELVKITIDQEKGPLLTKSPTESEVSTRESYGTPDEDA